MIAIIIVTCALVFSGLLFECALAFSRLLFELVDRLEAWIKKRKKRS